MSERIIKTLQVCDKEKLNYIITLKNGSKVELTPTHYIKDNILSVYDEGWDVLDYYDLLSITDCVPIIKNKL